MTDDNGNPLAGARWSPDEERRLRDAEKQYGKHGDSLRPFVTPGNARPVAAPVKPTGGTVLEALEKLQAHAAAILADATDIENQLTGPTGAPIRAEEQEPFEAGIWGRLAAKIVMIERAFAQIDEAHAHAQASLK